MNIEWIRTFCLSMPYATEQIQWGNDLLFKVGGKMFAGMPLKPAPVWLTFKADPEEFYDLVEQPGIIPAPYMGRAKWVAMQNENALPRDEVKRLVKKSCELVFAKLPKKLQAELASGKLREKKGAAKNAVETKQIQKELNGLRAQNTGAPLAAGRASAGACKLPKRRRSKYAWPSDITPV
jgi:predicted DNA-binding protein (MmcQ/YjbR family)